MAPSATIPALTSTDLKHLHMTAYHLGQLCTDHGFPKLAAELETLAANDHVELIRYINRLWDALIIPLMQSARIKLDGLDAA